MPNKKSILLASLAMLAVVACKESEPQTHVPNAEQASAAQAANAKQPSVQKVAYTQERQPCSEHSAERMALFGDVHVHTSLSFDAAANEIGATPTDANAFAKGEAIKFWPLDENGKPIGEYQIDRPLDFLAVTDHGEFLGERRLCHEPGSPSYETDYCVAYRSDQRQGMVMLGEVITTETPERVAEMCNEDGSLCREYAQAPWQQMIEAAEAANDKSSNCAFTSFVAYEYTGTPGTSNYHRNVIFRNGVVPDLPVSYIDAPYDSALWNKLDAACSGDCDYLTIPHNSNLANGRMAPYMRLEPSKANRVAYAQQRQRREPIMEIFQHKGNSECVNGLTSILAEPDELCEIEAVRTMGKEEVYMERAQEGHNLIMTPATEVTEECNGEIGENGMLGAGCIAPTDYHRSGLLVGMAEQQKTGVNPVKLGAIAATDTHTAAAGGVAEGDWRGAVTLEATPEERLAPGLLTSGIDGNPGGLAGVWAVENSRDAIFEAMQRREVFGTTGPRIVPRFFAGWDFDSKLCEADNMVEQAYANGVPMGGDLADWKEGAKPTFLASALRDPAENSTALQKMELVKGWVDTDGKMHNKVISIAGSNVRDGKAGRDSFCAVYVDQDFDPKAHNYYYLRVVEQPVKRWHTYDCDAIAEDKRPAVCTDGSYPNMIQEMAWSSPIWITP